MGDPPAPEQRRSVRLGPSGRKRARPALPRRVSVGAGGHGSVPAGGTARAPRGHVGRLEHAAAGQLLERGRRRNMGRWPDREEFSGHGHAAGRDVRPQPGSQPSRSRFRQSTVLRPPHGARAALPGPFRRPAWGMALRPAVSRDRGAPFARDLRRGGTERVLQFRDDSLVDSTLHHVLRVGVIGGIAAHATSHSYTRLWGGLEWRREDFAPIGTTSVPYSVFTTARAGIEIGSVRFQVLEHFNSYARREDVDLSPTFRAGLVVQSGVGYEVSGQTSAVWKRGFALLNLAANGLDTTRTLGQLTVVSQNIPGHTLIVHAEGGVVTHPKPGREFDPWNSQRGPRLFGAHAFTGTRTTWFVFEDRVLVADGILGLMAVGVAPFLDYGGAWYEDEPARQFGDAGLALRLGPTRAVRGDVAEMAFGYRFGRGMPGKRWAFTVRKGFSF